jgi:hypothetical protein
MTNNASVFFKQQKNAFYGNEFETLTPEDLEQLIGKYRPKKKLDGFPAPEKIFDKHFKFLNTTLREMLKTIKKEPKPTETPKKNGTLDFIKVVEKKESEKEVVKSNKIGKVTKSPPVITIRRNNEKHVTKLGVVLEDNNDTDSDNSIIIPQEFNEIITNNLSGKDSPMEEDIKLTIETTPIAKREIREPQSDIRWVDKLLESDDDKLEESCSSIGEIARSPLLMLAPLSSTGDLQASKELSVQL